MNGLLAFDSGQRCFPRLLDKSLDLMRTKILSDQYQDDFDNQYEVEDKVENMPGNPHRMGS